MVGDTLHVTRWDHQRVVDALLVREVHTLLLTAPVALRWAERSPSPMATVDGVVIGHNAGLLVHAQFVHGGVVGYAESYLVDQIVFPIIDGICMVSQLSWVRLTG